MKLPSFRKFAAIAAFLFGLPIVFSACGGGNPITSITNPGQTVAQVKHFFVGHRPGFHGAVKTVQTASVETNPFAAYAQTTGATIVFTGNYTGFCQTIPNGNSFVVFGLGRLSDSRCDGNFTNIVQATDGEPVIGDGTLQNIVLLAQGGSTAQSGTLEIFVNGVSKVTTAAIGTGHKLADTTTAVPVKDGDVVAAVFHTVAGDNFQNLRVYIGKQ